MKRSFIRYSMFSVQQRKEMASTPHLDEGVQTYVARKTENYTPAEIQEVIYSLVIGYAQSSREDEPDCLKFSLQDIDSAVSKLSRRTKHQLGFSSQDNHDSKCVRKELDLSVS